MIGLQYSVLLVVVVLNVAAYPALAWAVLGEPATSIELDRSALDGALSSIGSPAYQTYVITAPDVVLKELVAPGGDVFAVLWRGRRPPHLGTVLGAYFEEYQQTLAATKPHGPGRRGGTRTESRRVVVETGGHSGDVRGRAYLPALLPPGVRIEDLQ